MLQLRNNQLSKLKLKVPKTTLLLMQRGIIFTKYLMIIDY